jgi:hypothetical protein
MSIAKCIVAGFLAVIAMQPLWTSSALADTNSAILHVQATVRPYLQFSATQPSGSYRVTVADIRRGHIDLPQALTIQMKTNIRDEIRFDVASGGPERVLLKTPGGLSNAVRMAAASPATLVSQTLDMRIVLPSETREGVYPLQVALMPTAY